ncbi:MAG: DUF4954 family protein [Candidatus Hydrogenedentota bacterium]|nr:MAG: DUF4954 family protein [Candidatus Hydrogenedentota bacterium]
MTPEECLIETERLIRESDFLKAISRISSPPTESRALTEKEIERMEKNGNRAEDWSRVTVGGNFDPDLVHYSHFLGSVHLGLSPGNLLLETIPLPAEIWNTVLADCNVFGRSVIRNVSLLCRTSIQTDTILMNCGRLTTETPPTSFCIGENLSLGIETGGREVPLFPEITVEIAACVAKHRADHDFLQRYSNLVHEAKKRAATARSIIESGCRILNTACLTNFCIGTGTVVDGASLVKNTILLSAPEEPVRISGGASIQNSVVQWGTEVSSMAVVENSVLGESTCIRHHGTVTNSYIGPNTAIEKGEVKASLIGPFVGFHHQALLIAVLWPEGKGNVGYGANIGSNHTGKAPDQEFWPGEGTFFGLGCNIKFPSDFTEAPYSMVATNVTVLPQRLEFPFSLINTPAERLPGLSPAINELLPGWLLSENTYAVKRNEIKFKRRNGAERNRLVFEVFRPEIVDKMLRARKRLVEVPKVKEFYTSQDIPGLGKNYLKDGARIRGIEVYTFFIRYYALRGLYRRIRESSLSRDRWDTLLSSPSEADRWEHERGVLLAEFPGISVEEALGKLIEMQEKVAENVRLSKEKDDRRGTRIIRDYAEAHPSASEDSFVRETLEETAALRKEIESLLGED